MDTVCVLEYNEPRTYPQTAPPSYDHDQFMIQRNQAHESYFPQNTPGYGYHQAPDQDQSMIQGNHVHAPYFPQNGPGYGYNQAADQYGAQINPSPRSQQADIVISQPGSEGTTVMVSHDDPEQDTKGHVAFSCVVAWCFCFVFGIIAYGVAIDASRAVTAEERRRKLKISMGFSLAGLVISVAVYITVIALRVNSYHVYY